MTEGKELSLTNLDLLPVRVRGQRVRILRRSAARYKEIGSYLLNDKDGSIVASLEYLREPEKILREIFSRWLQNDTEHSWEQLIQCLRGCELNGIADDAETALGLRAQGTLQPPSAPSVTLASHATTSPLSCWPQSCCYSITLVLAIIVVCLAVILKYIDIPEVLYRYHNPSLPNLPKHFVGREDDIRNITKYLDFDASNVHVVYIVGPPGFGKSTLAIKVGHLLLRKGVTVYYVDLKDVSDVNTLAEKLMACIVGHATKKVSFQDVKKWVSKQYSRTLILFDNCDSINSDTNNEEFLAAIDTLRSSSGVNKVKYLITSQEELVDIDFQLHAIYNLSTEAASQLLRKLVPSLSVQESIKIAELTGNVPLALDVIGAIFKFRSAPTASKLIGDLERSLIPTLSPQSLRSSRRINVSIGLAYQYLSPELQALGRNISLFPGSFDKESVHYVLAPADTSKSSLVADHLEQLVQRSLLQFTRNEERYQFHQLIKRYFLDRIPQDESTRHFDFTFQEYYTAKLQDLVDLFKGGDDRKALKMLECDKHNFQHMFNLLLSAMHPNYTYRAVEVTFSAISQGLLELRFTDIELRSILQHMLQSLDKIHTNSWNVSKESHFFLMFTEVVIRTARHETSVQMAINVLSDRRTLVDKGFQENHISVKTYVVYYTDLADYYDELGDESNMMMCHTHLLKTAHNELSHCYPNCNYYSISTAYERVQDTTKEIHFKELSLTHQTWEPLTKVHIMLKLYHYYLLSQKKLKAENMSQYIVDMLPDLIKIEKLHISEHVDTRDSPSAEEMFYDVIDFLREKQMTKSADDLMEKIRDIYLGKLERNIADLHRLLPEWVRNSYVRECYLVTMELGPKAFEMLSSGGQEDILLLSEIALYVGISLYRIGNYSGAQVWLLKVLEITNKNLNEDLSDCLREKKFQTCFYLSLFGDYRCSLIVSKEMIILSSVLLFHFILRDEIDVETYEDDITATSTEVDLQNRDFFSLHFSVSPLEYLIRKLHLAVLQSAIIKNTLYVLVVLVKFMVVIMSYLYTCVCCCRCFCCCNSRERFASYCIIPLIFIIAYFHGGRLWQNLLVGFNGDVFCFTIRINLCTHNIMVMYTPV